MNSVIGEFTRWVYETNGNDDVSCFTDWISNVSAEGLLQIPSALTADGGQRQTAIDYGWYPPEGWSISGIEDIQAAANTGSDEEDEEDE